MPTSSTPVVEIVGLRSTCGDRTVLDGLDLAVPARTGRRPLLIVDENLRLLADRLHLPRTEDRRRTAPLVERLDRLGLADLVVPVALMPVRLSVARGVAARTVGSAPDTPMTLVLVPAAHLTAPAVRRVRPGLWSRSCGPWGADAGGEPGSPGSRGGDANPAPAPPGKGTAS